MTSKHGVSQKRQLQARLLVQQAAGFYQQRQWGAVIDACQQAMQQYPNCPDALNLLALTSLELGEMQSAAALIQQAIAGDSNRADFYSNAGAIWQRLGNPEQAAAALIKAVALDPSMQAAGLNLARVQLAQDEADKAIATCLNVIRRCGESTEACFVLGLGQAAAGLTEQARSSFEKVIGLSPAHFDAMMHLAALFYNEKNFLSSRLWFEKALAIQPQHCGGRLGLLKALNRLLLLDQTEEKALSLIKDEPECSDAYWLLSNQYQMQQRLDDWRAHLNRSLSVAGLEFSVCEKMKVHLAMLEWLQGDIQACEVLLADIHIEDCPREEDADARNGWAYWLLMKGLVKYSEQHPELYRGRAYPLYMLGDSHTLTFHGTTQPVNGQDRSIRSSLVVGCKAWHLAQQHTSDEANPYRHAFECALAGLPDGADEVLVCFGEIDCRSNEGFLLAWGKSGVDPENSVRTTISAYVEYVCTACRERGVVPVFYGVPAPCRDFSLLNEKALTVLTRILRLFNQSLATEAGNRGLSMIDPYSLTVNDQGMSDGTYHMDLHHLQPGMLAAMPYIDAGSAADKQA